MSLAQLIMSLLFVLWTSFVFAVFFLIVAAPLCAAVWLLVRLIERIQKNG